MNSYPGFFIPQIFKIYFIINFVFTPLVLLYFLRQIGQLSGYPSISLNHISMGRRWFDEYL